MLYPRFLFWVTQSQGVSKEQIGLVIYVIAALLLFAFLFVLFFSTFQKRKNQLFLDKIKQQKQFDDELIKTQQEIQEETLRHVGRELHDNVGQLLVVATIQLNAVAKVAKDDIKVKIGNASEALKETLTEVRALSRSLNSDVIFNLGFDTTVKNEVSRLNKMGLVVATFLVTGKKVNFENKKDELILFRILQEFFSNTLKYADAEHLKIEVNYKSNSLVILLEDDGVGFDVLTAQKGSGLINMQKQAELINTDFSLESQVNKGTKLLLTYPYKLA
ncbi:histidine kinase [Winogradskyella sp.]|nr:histidine kinase [Winogradskyella sp.]